MSSFTKAKWELLNVGVRTFLSIQTFEIALSSEDMSRIGLKSLGFLSTFFLGIKPRFHWSVFNDAVREKFLEFLNKKGEENGLAWIRLL